MRSGAPPPHGTRSRYSQGCHCDRCRAANADYVRDRRGGAAAPNTWTPAEPVRVHVRELLMAGMSIPSVADAAGVRIRVLNRLMSGRGSRGPVVRMQAGTASRILDVQLPSRAGALLEPNPAGLAYDADLPVHEAWRRRRACRGVDTNVFFPGDEDDAGPAVAICRGCAVRMACLSYALTYRITDGVWGGLTEAQRRQLRRRIAASRVGTPRRSDQPAP
ncbi:MAG: WhiB family transcriptional regulator [Acidimicrobiales bacterium]